MTPTDHERRLDIAATILARGIRRVLGADAAGEHPPGERVQRENDDLPVRRTEAVMAAMTTEED